MRLEDERKGKAEEAQQEMLAQSVANVGTTLGGIVTALQGILGGVGSEAMDTRIINLESDSKEIKSMLRQLLAGQ